MLISIITLFPEMFEGPFAYSILKKAQEKKLLKIKLINLRDFATDRHQTVDDRPYGGGEGMIIKVDVVDRAIQSVKIKEQRVKSKERVILLDPQGKVFNQKKAQKLAKLDHLILVCGHYEGVDERIRNLVDEEISIGDYVLTGGEIPAMVVADTVARLIPKVLEERVVNAESFTKNLLDYPQYTRPPVYGKWKVPKILLSGNHSRIEKWRQEEAIKKTRKKRPDLFLIRKKRG